MDHAIGPSLASPHPASLLHRVVNEPLQL